MGAQGAVVALLLMFSWQIFGALGVAIGFPVALVSALLLDIFVMPLEPIRGSDEPPA